MHERNVFSPCFAFEAKGTGRIEGDVIKGAKVLGFVSESHKRRYPAEAMKVATHLYEGKPVFANHNMDKLPNRKIEDSIGAVQNVRFEEGRGLIGDLVLNPHHEMTPRLKWAAENLPAQFALSHMADLYGVRESDGFFKTHDIEAVHSVDVVSAGGTTSSIFESRAQEDHTMEGLLKLSVAEIAGARPDLFVTSVVEHNGSLSELQRLKDRVTALEGEKKSLALEVDGLKAEKALEARKVIRNKAIDDAKLPKEVDTVTFRELALESSSDEAFNKLLTERKELAKGVKTPVSGRRSVGEAAGVGSGPTDTKGFVSHLRSGGVSAN